MKLEDCIEIVRNEIIPQDAEIAREILERYIERTKEHVKSVNEYAKKASEFLKDHDWCCLFKANVINHDHDKLNDHVFIAHYCPYVVKRYCTDDLKDKFQLTDEYKVLWDRRYVVQHCKNNGHHPEGWCRTYDYGENNPPYDAVTMPPEYVAEMVCDWCAVGKEQGNDPMDWYNKVNGPRFIFNDTQQAFIEWLIEAIK